MVHGCFWHRHVGCRFAYSPKSRIQFWEKKFDQNVERDKVVLTQLRELGWEVLVIWECEIKDIVGLDKALTEFLGPTRIGSNQ